MKSFVETRMVVNRREFLGSMGAVSLVMTVGISLPLEATHATSCSNVAAGTWSVDDICGHWPPYSHPIPYGRCDGLEVVANTNVMPPSLDELLVA